MDIESSSERFFVDPSILMSDAGLQWLEENPSSREGIVVSASFLRDLEQRPNRLSSIFVPQEEIQLFGDNGERLRSLLEGVVTYDYGEAKLEEEDAQVLYNLLSIEDPETAALADEWAYLQSQSWGISRARAVLEAFGRAGALVGVYGRRARDEAILVAVREGAIPERITPPFLARVGAKWLLLGGVSGAGAVVGAAVSAVIGPLGVAGGATGAFLAGQAGRAIVRALDS